ncbi:amino acid permease/ SLC12A domain-containing protein [Naematelia encephala]|uniref:Amino acid permease/ SLC12A domain-containing protein n=1 Tax=Naematelia encephala TaxID=71784 RepID=A0A1Y2BBH6_9TREE|nr:amino acid permease/ SLC12A domain-containing protein [Naematelia encephala]
MFSSPVLSSCLFPFFLPLPLLSSCILSTPHLSRPPADPIYSGTGLFLGTGGALANGGPLGLFMGYALMGSICFAVMMCLGEMVAYLPIPGGHIKLAERFVDPALSFTMGWNYWYNWVIILPAELSAAAVLINYWNDSINNALWISICLIVVVVINMFGAGAYGEAEFWFASIKVLTITGLIILGIIISAGGGPNHKTIGFHYWRDPGPFTQYENIAGAWGQFLGFWAVLTQAAFSYIGTEIVAIAAGEARNPRRNIPRAIKRVYVRILIFYLGGTFVIGLIVDPATPQLKLGSGIAQSPWVIAIRNAGIPALPSIINACLLTSAWSAASSDLYTSSRALYGLALTHQAPKIFARTTRRGLPYISLIFCTLFAGLAYMSLQKTAGQVFNDLANLTAAAGLLTWLGICITYIRFAKGMREQGIDRRGLPFASRMNYKACLAWYASVLIVIILFFSSWTSFRGGFDAESFFTNYIPCILFPIMWVGYKLIFRTKFVRASEMDFESGLEEIEADSYEEPKPRNAVERVWAFIM